MADFAHYQQRRVACVSYKNPDHPWFAEHQADDQGFVKPEYHTTRRENGPSARIKTGDSIWVFSQLVTPWGNFPAALDFRIDVKKVENRSDGGFRYEAKASSRWFDLFSAAESINRLKTLDSKGRVSPLLSRRDQHIGRALQSIRQLSDAGPLVELERDHDSAGFDFISYRLIDGTKAAFRKAKQLVESEKAVFWDRWSLPRRLAERREFLSDKALDRHLSRIIDGANVVWAIETPKYGEEGSYSKKEFKRADSLGKARLVDPR